MNFYKPLIYYILLLLLVGCSASNDLLHEPDYQVFEPDHQINNPEEAIEPVLEPDDSPQILMESSPSVLVPQNQERSQQDIILEAEQKATDQGRKILTTGWQMAIIDKEIIPGGCWDYANEIFNRAGYPNTGRKRKTIFKGAKKGPYAAISLIQPGDFLYYINHSYGDIEHSAIFVDWIDYTNKEALMLSYGGENRRKPARYLSYDLSSVYRIIRAIN